MTDDTEVARRYTPYPTQTHYLSHTRALTLSLTLSHSQKHTRASALTLSHTHIHTSALTLTHSHMHTHTHTHTLSHSHTHAHAHIPCDVCSSRRPATHRRPNERTRCLLFPNMAVSCDKILKSENISAPRLRELIVVWTLIKMLLGAAKADQHGFYRLRVGWMWVSSWSGAHGVRLRNARSARV